MENIPLKERIEDWQKYAERGYELKRVDNEVWVRYMDLERHTDKYGAFYQKKLCTYPIDLIRENPERIIRDIQEHERIRNEIKHEARSCYFARNTSPWAD